MAEKLWSEMSAEEQDAGRQRTSDHVDKWLADRNARAAEAPNMLTAPVREIPGASAYPSGVWNGGNNTNGGV